MGNIDGIQREDWGAGGENRQVVPAQTNTTPAHRLADQVPAGTAMSLQEISQIDQPQAGGCLGPELTKTLTNTHDGFAANSERMDQNLGRYEQKFADEFGIPPDVLNPLLKAAPAEIKDAIREAAWRNGHMSAQQLCDHLQNRGFTLTQLGDVIEAIRKARRR